MSRPFKTDNACGTPAGEKRHRRRGTRVCEPCLAALADYQAERYRDRNVDERLVPPLKPTRGQMRRAAAVVLEHMGASGDTRTVLDALFQPPRHAFP